MTKPKHTAESVRKSLRVIYDEVFSDSSVDYLRLMEQHRGIISWAVRELKDDRTAQEMIRRVKKQCLIRTVIRLSQEGSISLVYIQDKYPGLDRATKEFYKRNNRESPWRQLVEEAGIAYPGRNLRRLLEGIEIIGEDLDHEDFRTIYRANRGIMDSAEYLIGNIGKAAILTGRDYLNRKRVFRSQYTFGIEDLTRIMQDDSLTPDEKTKCVFNALSLQFYDLSRYGSQTWREIDGNRDSFRVCKEKAYLEGRLGLSVEQNEDDLSLFRNAIRLKPGIVNRLHETYFYFLGEEAGFDVGKFNERLEDRLTKSGIF